MTIALLALAAALVVSSIPRRARRRSGRPIGWSVRRFGRLPTVPLVAAVLVSAVSLWAGWAAGLSLVILGATARARLRGTRAARRRERELWASSTALDVMVAELRVGADPAAACTAAADEIAIESGGVSARVGEVFRRAAATARLGGSISTAFAAADDLPSRRIARVTELTERYGLESAVLLDSLRRDLGRRMRFEAHVRSSLAGARATATVLALLPVPGVALGALMGADPFAVLLGPGWSGGLLVVGVVLGCLGLLWSDAITDRAGG